ncbi:MAG: RluA family pseudouridine synthase [Candidatus Saccharibacteria bacterium]|nr:RluA family pseudouridine synthase [Candidatus Saccharibacteria bacterium]
MKLSVKDAKQILKDFAVFNHESVITTPQKTELSERSFLFQFSHDKKQWAILFDSDIDEEDVLQLAPWTTGESQLIPNPNQLDSTALPFRQKTCYLMVHNFSQIRLDSWLAQQHPDYSRARLQKMIKNNQVLVNYQPETSPKRLILPTIDEVELLPEQTTNKQVIDFKILFENNDLIVINKPAGVLVHPATESDDSNEYTVADFAREHGNFTKTDWRAGIVHRLDRTTSGIMIIAKNATTANYLKQQFADRQVHKTYHAIVTGAPKHLKAKLNLPLKRSLKNAGKFMVDASGKEATTVYEIINSTDNHHLVKLQPHTGRTHQLRVHMSYIGLPILGDYLYGGQKYSRVMLHASEINFIDQHGKQIVVSSPLPSEFQPWMN